jgi:hypothetical protein
MTSLGSVRTLVTWSLPLQLNTYKTSLGNEHPAGSVDVVIGTGDVDGTVTVDDGAADAVSLEGASASTVESVAPTVSAITHGAHSATTAAVKKI